VEVQFDFGPGDPGLIPSHCVTLCVHRVITIDHFGNDLSLNDAIHIAQGDLICNSPPVNCLLMDMSQQRSGQYAITGCKSPCNISGTKRTVIDLSVKYSQWQLDVIPTTLTILHNKASGAS